ncbi:hypothetical protein DFP72DRAFT_922712 [Ephemerocybe angulata]|uniref:Uncharacterized protein n=1 Tax=Ephemerocybe angulata TaxID=980116 RepID=A0A8H6LZT9_9AGAR|nr:hypothetical protein DFP72DRAFT_922712 [Tulosesus angulatus]
MSSYPDPHRPSIPPSAASGQLRRMSNFTHGHASSTQRRHLRTSQHLRTSNARLYFPNRFLSRPHTPSPRPLSSGATSSLCSSQPESAFRLTFHSVRLTTDPCMLDSAAVLTLIDAVGATVPPHSTFDGCLRWNGCASLLSPRSRSPSTGLQKHQRRHRGTPSPVLSASDIEPPVHIPFALGLERD